MTHLKRLLNDLLDRLAERIDVGGEWARLTDLDDEDY